MLLADHSSGPEVLAHLPNTNFFKTGSGTKLANFNGNDWILLVTYDRASDSDLISAGRVLDVIGDTANAPGPWAGTDFTTKDVALSKKQVATIKTYYDYVADDSVTYTWIPDDWSKVMEFDSSNSALTGSYDWLGYHFSDVFICKDHDQCPSKIGFCSSAGSKCKACDECIFDRDAIDGKCPDKCPATCGGDIFPGDTCAACGSTYKIPSAASSTPVLKKSSKVRSGEEFTPNADLPYATSLLTTSLATVSNVINTSFFATRFARRRLTRQSWAGAVSTTFLA